MAAKTESGLNKRQQLFAEEYCVDYNGAQAAIRAGYAKNSADVTAAKLLGNPRVAAEIERRTELLSRKTTITAARVLEELGHIGFLDAADLASIKAASGPQDIPKLPEHVRRAIAGWSWDKQGNFTLKIEPKTKALELIGKHLAMFTDRTEHTGNVTVNIEGNDGDL